MKGNGLPIHICLHASRAIRLAFAEPEGLWPDSTTILPCPWPCFLPLAEKILEPS